MHWHSEFEAPELWNGEVVYHEGDDDVTDLFGNSETKAPAPSRTGLPAGVIWDAKTRQYMKYETAYDAWGNPINQWRALTAAEVDALNRSDGGSLQTIAPNRWVIDPETGEMKWIGDPRGSGGGGGGSYPPGYRVETYPGEFDLQRRLGEAQLRQIDNSIASTAAQIEISRGNLALAEKNGDRDQARWEQNRLDALQARHEDLQLRREEIAANQGFTRSEREARQTYESGEAAKNRELQEKELELKYGNPRDRSAKAALNMAEVINSYGGSGYSPFQSYDNLVNQAQQSAQNVEPRRTYASPRGYGDFSGSPGGAVGDITRPSSPGQSATETYSLIDPNTGKQSYVPDEVYEKPGYRGPIAAAGGFAGTVDEPTVFIAGEEGPENVRVKPLAEPLPVLRPNTPGNPAVTPSPEPLPNWLSRGISGGGILQSDQLAVPGAPGFDASARPSYAQTAPGVGDVAARREWLNNQMRGGGLTPTEFQAWIKTPAGKAAMEQERNAALTRTAASKQPQQQPPGAPGFGNTYNISFG